MTIIVIVICVALVGASVWTCVKYNERRAQRQLEQHSITPDTLHSMMTSHQQVLVVDVRQPLDLLANSEIILGAKRIPPKDLLENPSLIPPETEAVVYCTCPADETSRRVLRRVLDMHFLRVKLLKGGLAAWKAKGYPVEPYITPFHLDIQS